MSRKPLRNSVILAPLKLSCVGRGYNKELDGLPAANILSREPLLLFFLFFLFFFLFGPIFILKCAYCKAYLTLIRPLDKKGKKKQQKKHAFEMLANSTLVQRAKYKAETSLWCISGESAKLIAGLPRCNMNSMADLREEVKWSSETNPLSQFCSPGQNYLVAIKITAGASAGKPQVPTPAGASPKRTAKGQSTRPTVATPTTKATPSPQSSIENKESLILLYCKR